MGESVAQLEYDYEPILVRDPEEAGLPQFACESGLDPTTIKRLRPQLEAVRTDVAEDIRLVKASKDEDELEEKLKEKGVLKEKWPLDAGFIDLPAQILHEKKELARIQEAAGRLAEEVDRVVVLGIGGSYMGARALFEALRHPFFNELSRKDRNKRPRIYFEGNNVDNAAMRGLLDLLSDEYAPPGSEGSWGIIVISKSGGTLETGVAFRVFLERLQKACEGRPKELEKRILAVSSEGSKLWNLVKSVDVPDENLFSFPNFVGGRFSILSAVGLLPAAVMGIDIDQLLQGAQAITDRYLHPDSGDSIVDDFVAVSHLMEYHRGLTLRVLSTWGKRLEAVGLWYDQLLAESLGKDGRGATPLTMVNTRDLHSRGQQHQEGARDRLFTNLIVEEEQGPLVRVPSREEDEDELNELVAGKALPEILRAAYQGTDQALEEDFRRTATIRMPRLDAHCLGQLFQMLMLTTVVEGRLIGINPYGQPGVEAYKKNMQRILRG